MNSDMLAAVRAQLALDLNCAPEDLLGDNAGFAFVRWADKPGRRPFPRTGQHLEMLSMGGQTVVSATEPLLQYARQQLHGKTRDEAFSAPFVYGHSLYYLPDRIMPLPAPGGFEYDWAEREGMAALYETEGFRNALGYDLAHPRPDVLAFVARQGGQIVGMAGASADAERMWQVGIDVRPEFRGHGLAAYLISELTREILRRGFIPYYGTASSNIPSQRVAHRTGYQIAWMCVYHVRIDGIDTLPSS